MFPPLLVFWGILGQLLLPLDFHQLVKLHGGLNIFHRGMSAVPDLCVPVQQLLGELPQRHGGFLWEVGFPVEAGRGYGRCPGLGLKVLEGFEVIGDGTPHHIFPVGSFKICL